MMKKEKITLASDTHRNKHVVLIGFARNQQIIDLLKQHFSAHWSQSNKAWWIARNEFDYKKFKAVFSPLADILAHKENETNKGEIKLPDGYLKKLERVRYSESTIRTYSKYFKDFLKAFQERILENIQMEEINDYIHKLIKEKSISNSQQNQRINGIHPVGFLL